jgi:uncharacterized protein (DUF362 family)
MKPNPYVRDGLALVSKVSATGDLKADIARAVELIGGFEKILIGGETVLLKPNYNTADPYPGSSDPKFVGAVVALLREHGAGQVVIGESTAYSRHHKVLEEAGLMAVARELGVEAIVYDEDGWERVRVGGRYLKRVKIAKALRRFERLVYVCCPKTHHAAQFTGSLKLGMGLIGQLDRFWMHLRYLQEKIAEMNLTFAPDLILADMRQTFIKGGPAKGELREPRLILASGDRVALDVEAIKIIQNYPGHALPNNPWKLPQITHAATLGMGASSEAAYRVLES